MKIFPNLRPGLWKKANFNEEAKKFAPLVKNVDDQSNCTKLVDLWHKLNKVDYSFGGYLEDRSYLFRNKYHAERGTFIHLGVDYNVPANTEVAIPYDCTVIDRWYDPDKNGGWGGRLVLEVHKNYEPDYMVFAHLKPYNLPMPGKKLYNSKYLSPIIGVIGEEHENGGWYPHLHIQILSKEAMNKFDIRQFDGYAKMYDGIEKDFPNPENFVENPS